MNLNKKLDIVQKNIEELTKQLEQSKTVNKPTKPSYITDTDKVPPNNVKEKKITSQDPQ